MIDDRYERELTEARRQALHRELRTGGPVLVPRPVELELGERIAVTPEFLAQQRAELDRLRAQVQAVRELCDEADADAASNSEPGDPLKAYLSPAKIRAAIVPQVGGGQ